MEVLEHFATKYSQLKEQGFQVTRLCEYLIQRWLNFVKNHQRLKNKRISRNKVFQQVLKDFLNRQYELDLSRDRAFVARHPNYQGPYLSDVVLEFEDSPLSFQIPYSFYMLGVPELVPYITQRLDKLIEALKTGMSGQIPVLDAQTFLSWLFEDNRKLPLKLTRLDLLILQTVANLDYYRNVHVLHSARRIIAALNLREEDRTTVEKRMRFLKDTCAWRPKFGNNMAPLGFKTFYIEWNGRNEWLRMQVPMHELAMLEVFHPEINCGIYQVPFYWTLTDVIETNGGKTLDALTLSLNLNYLRPETLAPYQRKSIDSAEFPIDLDPNKITFSTNKSEYSLIPTWDNTTQISSSMLKIIKFFSIPNNNIDRHAVLTRHLRISRELFSDRLEKIVELEILFYFPQFIRIGMDSRVIVLIREKQSQTRDALMSSLACAPRMLSFSGNDVALAFLNVGSKQVSGLVRRIEELRDEHDIICLPNLVSGTHYKLQNVPLHGFKEKRRSDDKKILFYHDKVPEELMGLLY